MQGIIGKIWQSIKPVALAVLVIVFLRATGLMSSVSYFTQSALVGSGFRDASDQPLNKSELFDYNFAVKDKDGTHMEFKDLKGKVIFLNIWATWCGPCRAEMPTIQSLYEHTGDSVAFVMLSVDAPGDEHKIVKYITKNKFTFPVFRPSGYLTEQLNVPGIPTTFIISKDGRIVSKEVGATNFNTARFRKFLEKLLNE